MTKKVGLFLMLLLFSITACSSAKDGSDFHNYIQKSLSGEKISVSNIFTTGEKFYNLIETTGVGDFNNNLFQSHDGYLKYTLSDVVNTYVIGLHNSDMTSLAELIDNDIVGSYGLTIDEDTLESVSNLEFEVNDNGIVTASINGESTVLEQNYAHKVGGEVASVDVEHLSSYQRSYDSDFMVLIDVTYIDYFDLYKVTLKGISGDTFEMYKYVQCRFPQISETGNMAEISLVCKNLTQYNTFSTNEVIDHFSEAYIYDKNKDDNNFVVLNENIIYTQ